MVSSDIQSVYGSDLNENVMSMLRYFCYFLCVLLLVVVYIPSLESTAHSVNEDLLFKYATF